MLGAVSLVLTISMTSCGKVTVTATFTTMPSGLTYPQYPDVEVPDKQVSLLVQNYDYYPNG